jgi:disulfide bond formation protein DsbB
MNLRNYTLYFAWVIALTGLFWSIYIGEVLQMEPCHLCWYQRTAIFPLALFLGIAAYENDYKIARYAWPLLVFGGLFALYQSLMQIFPSLHSEVLCGSVGHCTMAGIFPFMSLLGFILMSILICIKPKK